MRNLRMLVLALMAAIAALTTAVSPVGATIGGVSETQSEPRSTTQSITNWKYVRFKMAPSIEYWQKVAQCETKGNWKDKGNFAGGLGIAVSTWEAYGGHDFAKHPSQATVLEQIIVANRISVFGYQTKDDFMTFSARMNNKPHFRKAVGFNGWGCIKTNSYLKPPVTTFTTKLPVSEEFYCPKYHNLFKKYTLPVQVFSYIAWRESRCNPGAVNAKWKDGKIVWTLNSNGTYDSGLLQINSSWFGTLKRELGHSSDDLFSAATNAEFASWILHFTSGRLRNWSIRATY